MQIRTKLEEILLKVQRPARYIGGELNTVVKPRESVALRTAFCFPDVYEIGMSHLGAKILYSLINSLAEYSCERVFMPSADMEQLMQENEIPLYTLESLHPLREFDIVAFTLQYELSYTTVLAMLDLAGIPLRRAERENGDWPLIIAGGPCACNPAPLEEFIDAFVIGEGEEVTLELLDTIAECKKHSCLLDEVYTKLSQIDGVFTPSKPNKVVRRTITDVDEIFFPGAFVVPFVEAVHDRAVTEVLRGCIRGCRFCQAGFICRPYREKSVSKILAETRALCESTGYDEVSLCSLSTSDHSRVEELLSTLGVYTDENNINLAMPSLRIDKFSDGILERIKSVRKSTLTFAPEAGTQRLRDVINKNITEENILDGCRIAFAGGYSAVKLYFMLGLPTETDDDIAGIADLVCKLMKLYKQVGPKRGISVSISLATFVPKPHTPFQFEPMISRSESDRRQRLLFDLFEAAGHKPGKSRKVKLSRSDYNSALIEAALARGGRELGAVIHAAFKGGCKLDSWGDFFDFAKWEAAFESRHVDLVDTATRSRAYDEQLPWDNIDTLVSKDYLVRENSLAHEGKTTPNCREKCSGCGVQNCKLKEVYIKENGREN
ncbi:MAG: TIGR03960 family B12-binding radical SAM protein [Oscillospiraceae bacterium]|nr:TIGR03960 family B12-binding radical SAM protein [Oscillospiraceae bacterium]